MISVNCKYNYIISSQWAVGTTIYVVKGLTAYSSPYSGNFRLSPGKIKCRAWDRIACVANRFLWQFFLSNFPRKLFVFKLKYTSTVKSFCRFVAFFSFKFKFSNRQEYCLLRLARNNTTVFMFHWG